MSNYFTEDDIRILEKTSKVREKAIDALTVEMPRRASDVLALVAVIESLDKTILAKAKLKIDDSSSRANEETQSMMRDLLLNLHKTSIKGATQMAPMVLPEEIEYTIAPSEMRKDIDEVSIKDF